MWNELIMTEIRSLPRKMKKMMWPEKKGESEKKKKITCRASTKLLIRTRFLSILRIAVLALFMFLFLLNKNFTESFLVTLLSATGCIVCRWCDIRS